MDEADDEADERDSLAENFDSSPSGTLSKRKAHNNSSGSVQHKRIKPEHWHQTNILPEGASPMQNALESLAVMEDVVRGTSESLLEAQDHVGVLADKIGALKGIVQKLILGGLQ